MNQGLWVWPSDERTQRQLAKRVSESEHLMAELKAIMRSKEGLSNAELDDATSDNSNWITLWATRQLLSLGFIEYKVDFFGNPGRYTLTDLGRDVLQKLTGQPAPAKPPAAPVKPPAPPATTAPPPATTAPPPATTAPPPAAAPPQAKPAQA
jgi:hypothetical protein